MITALLLILNSLTGFDADPYPRNPAIDILHYTFRIELNDSTNIIAGHADVTVRFRESTSGFQLNLTNKNAAGRGMEVFEATSSGKPLKYRHNNNLLTIETSEVFQKDDTVSFNIKYRGEPIDGLIIGKNKFGDRTFFGDNWPDRGRNWLPTIDHPHDKARVDFIVTAPDHYKVVATGELISEKNLPDKRREHHWKESADVAVKVMTIGVARFSVQESGRVDDIPVTTWVFPQNEQQGFDDFSVAPKIFRFMVDNIGPYSYEKLAHVQSKTRFGGLENASNIFYFENSVTGRKERESLIAHETAHQWFGNSVTENDWYHVWLSEGFATYFDALYSEATYGKESLGTKMKENRKEVIEYARKSRSVVIDTTIREINGVLSPSTYQKAAWVLHMLRERVGEKSFWDGIRIFYLHYRNGNAMTADFIKVMEHSCEKELDDFFNRWLYQDGHPHLSGYWRYDRRAKKLFVRIDNSGFEPPAGTKINIVATRGEDITSFYEVRIDKYPVGSGAGVEIGVACQQKPSKVELDPDVLLLFEGEIKEKP